MLTVVQWLTYLNPQQYFLGIIRGIFLKGAGLEELSRLLLRPGDLSGMFHWNRKEGGEQ